MTVNPTIIAAHPQLAQFLADHFGGYPDVAEAARDDRAASVDAYVDSFVEAVRPQPRAADVQLALADCELLLLGFTDPQAARDAMEFSDAGNPTNRVTTSHTHVAAHRDGFNLICDVVEAWN